MSGGVWTHGIIGALLLGCAGLVSAADMDLGLAVAPLSVHADELLGRRRLVVDWGAVSQAIPRTADDCDGDYRAMIAQFTAKRAADAPQIEARRSHLRAEASARTANIADDYDAIGQECDLSRTTQVETRRAPLAVWMRNIPEQVRNGLVLALFDASDAEQRRWAQRQVAGDAQVQLLALGWSSQAELDRWRHEVPAVSNLVPLVAQPGLSPRDLAARYGIDTLPAVLRFVGAEVVTTIGLGTGASP